MADSTQSSAGCELAVPVAEPDTESIVVEEVLSQDPPKLPKHAPRHHGRIMAVNIQSCGSKSAMRWLQALSLIQKEEQARVQKFHFEADSHRSLAGRLLLRLSIALDLECKPRSILLKRTATGKPFLAEIDGAPVNQNPIPEKSYSFNISHHGDWVILSAAYTRAIGIDITRHEKPRGSKSTEEYFTLMRSCFTEKEWALIRNPPPSPRRTTHPDFGHEDFDKMRQFYRHWALKESYLKATGEGIGIDLQRIEFSYNGDEQSDGSQAATVTVDGEPRPQWAFTVFHVDAEHYAAVCELRRKVVRNQTPTWLPAGIQTRLLPEGHTSNKDAHSSLESGATQLCNSKTVDPRVVEIVAFPTLVKRVTELNRPTL